MEQFFLTLISEKWIIYAMFALTYYLIIYKWVPYWVRKIEETLSESRRLQKETHEFFKDELNKISTTFVTEIKNITTWQKESDSWHIEHWKKLEEIKNIISKK
jgi:hypothetical protein